VSEEIGAFFRINGAKERTYSAPEVRYRPFLAADLVGCSGLAGSDEERTLARLRGLRSDLIDPAIAAHHGRVVKRTLWLKRHGLNISCVPRRLGDRCHKKEPQAVYGVH
jgi:hypothetical protein